MGGVTRNLTGIWIRCSERLSSVVFGDGKSNLRGKSGLANSLENGGGICGKGGGFGDAGKGVHVYNAEPDFPESGNFG